MIFINLLRICSLILGLFPPLELGDYLVHADILVPEVIETDHQHLYLSIAAFADVQDDFLQFFLLVFNGLHLLGPLL